MNCHEINTNQLHEKFILGQLSGKRKKTYERHLEECQVCSDELEAQKQLISGIRYAGRLAMKEEIMTRGRQIRERSRSETKYVFLRAAAVLLIAAFLPGLYFYYNHYVVLPQETLSPITAPVERSTSVDNGFVNDKDMKLSDQNDEIVIAPLRKAVQIKSEKDAITIEKKQKILRSVLEETEQIAPTSKERSSDAGAGMVAGGGGYSSKKGETSEMTSEEYEFGAMSEAPAMAAEESITKKTSDVMGISPISQKRKAASKMPLSSLQKPVKIWRQNGFVEFIARPYSNEIITDSLYHYISQDSLLRIYWPEMPQEYIKNSSTLKIDQESPLKFILLYDERKVYKFNIDSKKVQIIKIEY